MTDQQRKQNAVHEMIFAETAFKHLIVRLRSVLVLITVGQALSKSALRYLKSVALANVCAPPTFSQYILTFEGS